MVYKSVLFFLLVLTTSVILPGQTEKPGGTANNQTPKPSAPFSVASKRAKAIDPRESWTALPLLESGLPSTGDAPVVLGSYEAQDFTREIVRVQWRRTDPIDLYIVRPKGIAKPPVILYLYDYTADTDRFRNEGWCKRATQGGFAAVGFVSALSGQRFHSPRGLKEWFVSEMQEALATSTHDVQMVLNYLGTRDDLDVKTVGMFGQGSGGAIAILAASVDPRIVALDVLNPWGDWPDWIKGSRQIPDNERSEYLQPDFQQSISTMDPVTYLPKLTTKSLRVEQVMTDLVTPQAAKDKIAAAVSKPAELVRYESTEQHERLWRATGIAGWLRQQLRPTASRAPIVTTVASKE